MKIKERKRVRFKRWAAKAGRKASRYLVSTLLSILVMFIVIDILSVFYGHDNARDIATRSAVVAAQVMEQQGDKVLAKKQALREVERNLAALKDIRFTGNEVEVTVEIKTRSILLGHLPLIKRLTNVTASGTAGGEDLVK